MRCRPTPTSSVSNEITCAWQTSTNKGNAWMAQIFAQMHRAHPGKVHMNGIDNKPWFQRLTFSPRKLVELQDIVLLHCWPFWTRAGTHGGPLTPPYTHLGANMATLARALARAPAKPVWTQKFGVCATEMPEADISAWMETFTHAAIHAGVIWFT